MIEKRTKEKLIKEFRLMQNFEISARDLYLKIAADPLVQNKEVRDEFRNIARDEHKHIKIVETIIELIEKSL